MSAICGVVDFVGSVAEATLSPMLAALIPNGADGAEQWQQGPVALGRQTRLVLPEDYGRPVLWHWAAGRLTITADARLDNRAELLDLLRLPTQELAYSDSQLIAYSYQRWGTRCPEYLLGDFAIAIWDEAQQRLFCGRDHLGMRTLFYWFAGDRLRFASTPGALLASPGIARRPNRPKLAGLALPGLHHQLDEATFYADILSLPAGSTLTFDRAGLRKQRYWEPTPVTPLAYTSGTEMLEALRELLLDVVRVRLRSTGPVAALLSGGLDSSAIVSAARNVMADGAAPLHTLSAVLPDGHDSRLADERSYIDQYCRSDGGNDADGRLAMHYVSAPGQGPFDSLQARIAAQESPLLVSRHYLMAELGVRARQLGARVLLDGNGGELGASFHGDGYYAELLVGGRWSLLWRALRARSRVDQTTIAALIKREVLAILWPVASRPWRRGTPSPERSLIQPTFVQAALGASVDQLQRDQQQRQRVWPDHRRNQLRLIRGYYQKHANGPGFLESTGLEVRYPWRDRRLLEFCLAAPGDYKVRDGYKRNLLRAGLDGILPPAIQWRTSKTPFSPDYYQRYLAQQDHARDILDSVTPADPLHEVLDIAALKHSFARSLRAIGVAGNADALHTVPSGIYLITFLRQFSEFSV